MLALMKFLACLAALQLAHAFVVVATDGEWMQRTSIPLGIAVAIDCIVLLCLII